MKVMSEQTDKLKNRLKKFGLEKEMVDIYLCLLKTGESSALTISREIGMARTKVYRILDKLIDMRLVMLKKMNGGFRFVADDPGRIEELVVQKEIEVEEMKASLPIVVEGMNQLVQQSRAGSQVLYYQGQRGLSQVNWNLLRAKGEVLSYEVATADAYLPQKEAEKLRQGLVDHRIVVRTITNLTKLGPFTEIARLVKDFWDIRSIDKKVLEITADVFIYNDVYTWCQYLGKGEVFCVEIYNDNMAKMQRQIFENLWKGARMMKKVGEKGEVRI